MLLKGAPGSEVQRLTRQFGGLIRRKLGGKINPEARNARTWRIQGIDIIAELHYLLIFFIGPKGYDNIFRPITRFEHFEIPFPESSPRIQPIRDDDRRTCAGEIVLMKHIWRQTLSAFDLHRSAELGHFSCCHAICYTGTRGRESRW